MGSYARFLWNRRFRRVMWMVSRFMLQFWWLGRLKKMLGQERVAARYIKVYKSQANEFTETAVSLGGLLIKLGQFFSSRVDLLPKEYTDELATLQDTVRPVPFEAIKLRIETELGSLDQNFAGFDREPLAAASIGQVHCAKLRDGTEVAVKVLRPGIEEIVAVDLETLRAVFGLLKGLTNIGNSVDLDAVYSEFRETVSDELDFIKEGKSAERFAKSFANWLNIYLPSIYWNHTTEKVLTMEFVEGEKITDFEYLEQNNINKGQLAETLFACYLKQVLEDGFFHADPHPGNLLVQENGRLVFLDFGMVGIVGEEMKTSLGALVGAVVKQDAGGIVEAFRSLGFLRSGLDYRPLIKSVSLLLERFNKGKESFSGANVEELAYELRDFLYENPFQIPAQTTFLGKAFVTLVGICFGLNPEFDLLAVTTPYVMKMFPNVSKTSLAAKQIKQATVAAVALPGRINRLISGLESGDLRLHLTRSFEQRLKQSLGGYTSQLIRAVWAGMLFLAGIQLLVYDYTRFGEILMVIAAFLSLTALRAPKSKEIRRGRRSPPGFKRPKLHP